VTSVHSLTGISNKLERFFDYLYGSQQGYVYSPTKDPVTGNFKQYFFPWPTGKEDLVSHAVTMSATQEVYHGIALFKEPSSRKESFLGTNYIWAEFDGNLPELDTATPPPTIRIQSSTEGHEHWYWKLEGFITDISIVENITQRLAYHLQADLSCWDANQVLRPPGTVHQESKQRVSILKVGTEVTPIAFFAGLPELPFKVLQDGDIHHVPVVLDVIAKYVWTQENIQFFREMQIEKGHRSSALTKLGHICMEMEMSNAETLSILLNANARWKKYSDQNAKKRLLGIINYCRAQHPVDPIQEEVATKTKFKIYTYAEFMKTEIKLEWVIPDLLHRKGLMLISGPPGVGKSQLLMRLGERLAKGEQFLKWKAPRPIKTLFVSMEMPHEEVKYFYDQMRIEDSPLMNENMLILALGHSIQLNSKIAQAELNKAVEEFQPDGIWFDSFGRAVGDDINSEKIIFNTFDYVDAVLRSRYGLFVGFIHHNRKAQIGNKKPNKLEDLFGSQYIGAAITTGVGLWPIGTSEIELSCLKLRMSKQFPTFKIRRVPGLDFEINESKILASDTPLLGVNSSISSTGTGSSVYNSTLGDSI